MTTSILGELRNPQKHGPDSYRCLKGACYFNVCIQKYTYIRVYIFIYILFESEVLSDKIF